MFTDIKTINSNNPKNKQVSFTNISAFNTVANIESNILLNKGITDIGGFVVPQAIMSNNKDESIERVFKSALYFLMTFASPIILLPLFNKKALKHFKITENFKNEEKKILEVSKKYLSKDGEYLKEGIKLKSQELFGNKNGFNSILERYGNDTEKLRKDLINAHTAIHFTDFLTTNLMVASIPWLGNILTQYRTKRSGYSGAYKIADEEFTKKAAQERDKTKKIRLAATAGLAILPSIILPPLIKKGMLYGPASKNKIYKWFNKHAENFDYKKAIYMSRLTALAMWITSDYLPYQLACRDKYEYKDTVIRGTSIGLVFWGGDLVLKKLFAKISDRLFKTNLMNKEKNRPYTISELKNYKNIDSLKNISENMMRRTQKASVGLYIFNLALIMATLGFGLPITLNKILKARIETDKKDNPKNNIDVNLSNKPSISDFLNKIK